MRPDLVGARAQPVCFIAIACLAAAGCSGGASQPVELEVLRLADAVAAAMGRPTPMEQVAGLLRASLPGPHAELLRPAPTPHAPAAADGEVVSFRCPARLVGRPAILIVGDPRAGRSSDAQTQSFHCPASADVAAQVRVSRPVEHDKVLWFVRGLELDRSETPAIVLQPGARLQVALGLVPLQLPGLRSRA